MTKRELVKLWRKRAARIRKAKRSPKTAYSTMAAQLEKCAQELEKTI